MPWTVHRKLEPLPHHSRTHPSAAEDDAVSTSAGPPTAPAAGPAVAQGTMPRNRWKSFMNVWSGCEWVLRVYGSGFTIQGKIRV